MDSILDRDHYAGNILDQIDELKRRIADLERRVISADEFLDLLRSVDGAGSGLDADLLDGLDSTAFAILAAALNTFTGDAQVGGGLVVGSMSIDPATGEIYYTSNLRPVCGGTTYTGRVLVDYGYYQPSAGLSGFGSTSWAIVAEKSVTVPDGGGVLVVDAPWTFQDNSAGSITSQFSVNLVVNGSSKDFAQFSLHHDWQQVSGSCHFKGWVDAGTATFRIVIKRDSGDRKVNSQTWETRLWWALFV